MVPRTDPQPEATEPIDRDERLGEAIEAYLELAEEGSPPEPEVFAKCYLDLGEDLVAALEGLALVQGLVGFEQCLLHHVGRVKLALKACVDLEARQQVKVLTVLLQWPRIW